jgi:porin
MARRAVAGGKSVSSGGGAIHATWPAASALVSAAALLTLACVCARGATPSPVAAAVPPAATPPGHEEDDRRDPPAITSLRDLGAGISAMAVYRGEVFHSFGASPEGATKYAGLVDVTVRVDTAAAGWWTGGRFFAVAENGQGSGLSAEAGGVQFLISAIAARPHTELSQWGYRQSFSAGRVSLQVGRQDVNQMFCVNGPGGHFIQPSFTLIPTVPMPTFPAPALGVALVLEPAAPFALRMGFFDGGPRISLLGIDTFLDGSGGHFSVLEPAWRPVWGRDGRLGGSYRIGLWYHSGAFPDISDPSRPGFRRNYGAYLMAQQVVTRTGSGGGLSLFLQAGWSPQDRNQAARYLGLGLVSAGTLASRPSDILGLGLNRTRIVSESPGAGVVTMSSVELFYRIAVTAWLDLQPDVQYYGGAASGVGSGVRWVVHL